MSLSNLVERELKIPAKCCRLITASRAFCLVHENWLRAVQLHRVIPPAHAAVYDRLSEADCQLFLASSNSSIPKPWLRISLKLIKKKKEIINRNGFLLDDSPSPSEDCLVGKTMCYKPRDMCQTELLSSVARETRENLDKDARCKYPHALQLKSQETREASPCQEFNQVIREVLQKLFHCSISSLSSDTRQTTHSASNKHKQPGADYVGQHVNVHASYAIFESSHAFYVIQPYFQYTLRDLVRFSPAKFSHSNAKPLFLLYQILQAVRYCHSLGLPVGELSSNNISVDENMWVKLLAPHIDKLYTPIQKKQGVTFKNDSDSYNQGSDNRVRSHILLNNCAAYTMEELPSLVQQWVHGDLSSFSYLMILNHLAGRRMGDPDHHPILPWVVDFNSPGCGYRDLTKSKFRLNKGDKQLDLTYGMPTSGPHCDFLQIPHHVTDFLSNITYFVYKARRMPKSILCTHVRSKWVPNEYPATMERMQEWTPDECIPEFFTDPTIFASIHDDLPDLKIPSWAHSAKDFVEKHMVILESENVSINLHHWIDLTFGYKLSGSAAVNAKNICLQLVDEHSNLINHGVVQLFNHPHPPRLTSVTNVIYKEIIREDGLEIKVKKSKKERGNGVQVKSEEPTIYLPKDFSPVHRLEQLEALHEFTAKVSKELPQSRACGEASSGSPRHYLISRDLEAFGCLIVESFLSQWTQVQPPDTGLDSRCQFASKVSRTHMEELPRTLRYAVRLLLHLNKSEDSEDEDTHPFTFYPALSADGLPPLNVDILLEPTFNILPFPPYFPQLYTCLSKVMKLDSQISDLLATTSTSDGNSVDVTIQINRLAKEKVTVMERFVTKKASTLGEEGLDLIMPFVMELLETPLTSVNAAWMLFSPLARALGAKQAVNRFSTQLIKLFNEDIMTPKHMKLYHRSFIIQLIVHLGLEPFLTNFCNCLIEAAAGYKNFFEDNGGATQLATEVDEEQPSEHFDLQLPSVVIQNLENDQSETDCHNGESSLEGVGAGGMFLLDADDLKTQPETEGVSSDSGSVELGLPDKVETSSTLSGDNGNDDEEVFAEGSSMESVETGEDALSKSLGRISVHSVSRLLEEEHQRRERSGSSSSHSSLSPNDQSFSAGSQAADNELDLASRESSLQPDALSVASGRSVPSNMTPSLLGISCLKDYNIGHVAAETIKWLSHRLGPVLTAKYMSQNLLRMLALCYFGDEHLEFINIDETSLCTTNKRVLGDVHATHLLDCLAFITIMYGEHVILLQYFQHVRELVSSASKKLTTRGESGLIGSLSLLIHILPYLSDSTLMDVLNDEIFKEMLLPILKLASSQHVSFPSTSQGRSVLCYKLVDVLYIISLRIGFEMTRVHMTFVLQKFFAAFNRVYEDLEKIENSESTDSPSPHRIQAGSEKPDLNNSMYFEIKMNMETREYKIGTPVQVESVNSRVGEVSVDSFRLELSPTPHEETDEGLNSPTDREHIMMELRETFTPELAHAAYIPFCKLAGGIHMEQNLINDDLIRKLCSTHDQALTLQEYHRKQVDLDQRKTEISQASASDQLEEQLPRSPTDDIVSGTFGKNVCVAGNKIMIREEDPVLSPTLQTRRRSGEPLIDHSKLRSPEMDNNKQRHLRGNWLAYWEHEVGLGDRERGFNFKQIKLQTFAGHSNCVRCMHILDNENSFLSASKDKTVKLWSLRSIGDGSTKVGCQWTYTHHRKSVFAVNFIDSVSLVASCDGSVHIWDPFLGKTVRYFESTRNTPVTVMTPMPPPSTMLMTASVDSLIRFIDIRSASNPFEFKFTTAAAGQIRCAAVGPDGTWVAVGYSTGVLSVLDVRTGLLIASWKGHEGEILQIKAFNAKSFLTSSFDQTMTLWSADEGKALFHIKGPTEPVHCFLLYKKMIISASTSNRVGIHTSVSSQASFTSTKLKPDVFRGVLATMDLLPLNRLLLLGSDSGNIRLVA